MSMKPGFSVDFELNEMHKALIGVSRLGELRQSLSCELDTGGGGDEIDGILALLNGTIAEINEQIAEAISRAGRENARKMRN